MWRFCLGWCQISYHARTMPPNSFHLCALHLRASFERCLGGIFHVPISGDTWLHVQVSIKKGDRDSPPAFFASSNGTENLCFSPPSFLCFLPTVVMDGNICVTKAWNLLEQVSSLGPRQTRKNSQHVCLEKTNHNHRKKEALGSQDRERMGQAIITRGTRECGVAGSKLSIELT